MKKDITIGKHTLGTLTIGMYTDSRIIFREYIQNATDAIDKAVEAGLLENREEGRIEIKVSEEESSISIMDNGCGVEQLLAWSCLTDVGNSAKQHDKNRGFRGIGRLAGLTYAEKLQFVTSSFGETEKSIITWDCVRLRELLQPGKHKDYDLPQVISEVANITYEKADEEEHFFCVKLIDVGKEFGELLDENELRAYLSQTAPVPFDSGYFPYYNDTTEGIRKHIEEIGKPLEEYNIYLNDDANPIYKPYCTRFNSGRGDNTKSDTVQKVEYIAERDEGGNVLFFGWYAITGFYGVIKDTSIAGLRLRQGNILIGSHETLNDFFTEKRFNSYFIGEIYVYDTDVRPNGQRNDFERNGTYWKFRKKLEYHTKSVLSKLPRSYSEYNSALKKIHKGEEALSKIEEKANTGISSDKEREELHKKRDIIEKDIQKCKNNLEKAKNKIEKRHSKTIEQAIEKADALEKKSKQLENTIIDSDYILDKEKALSGHPSNVKKVIKDIFRIIDTELEQEVAKYLQTKIIEHLKTKKKNEEKK